MEVESKEPVPAWTQGRSLCRRQECLRQEVSPEPRWVLTGALWGSWAHPARSPVLLGFVSLSSVCLFSFLLECRKLLGGEDSILHLGFRDTSRYLSRFLLFKNLVLVIEKTSCQLPLSGRSIHSGSTDKMREMGAGLSEPVGS